jgi:hypothetical protein
MSLPRYRIVVEGELGPRYASAFDGMTLRAGHGETEITGPIIDDAHLQGLLERIAGLGLRLYSVNPLGIGDRESEPPTPAPPAAVKYYRPGITSQGP